LKELNVEICRHEKKYLPARFAIRISILVFSKCPAGYFKIGFDGRTSRVDHAGKYL